MTATLNLDEKIVEGHFDAKLVRGGRDLYVAVDTTETRHRQNLLAQEQQDLDRQISKLEANDPPSKADREKLLKLYGEREMKVFASLAMELVDEKGEHPKPEWLAEHLPFTLVSSVNTWIYDQRSEVASPPPTPPTPSSGTPDGA